MSHEPVFGTATEPSTVPVADPLRTWIVPPAPPETTRARKEVAPPTLTPLYAAQSPGSM